MDFTALGIAGIGALVSTRRASVLEIVEECLDGIRRFAHLNAFIDVADDAVRRRARALDALPRSRRQRLHGVPYAVKDVIATRDFRTTNGSRVTADWRPRTDATVITRLHDMGAVLIGKLNLWEFGISGTSFAGDVLNPWSAGHSPGGSSSGSGAAVAAGIVPFALGTDTGGSVRVPAAWCGVTGLRPTYGRIPRDGVTTIAWSVDTVGPLAARAEDVATVFGAIADRGRSGRPGRRSPMRGLRIGLPRRYFFEDVHGEVDKALTNALGELQQLGSKLVEIDVPHAAHSATIRTLHLAEAAQYHERRLRERGHLFGPALRMRLEEAEGYTATDYIKALRIRTLLQRELAEVFKACDLFVTPADVNPPPAINATGDGAPAARRNRGNTFLASMTGIPSLAVPCGFTAGPPPLPIGMLLHAPPFEDELLFSIARAYQRATDWHLRRPG